MLLLASLLLALLFGELCAQWILRRSPDSGFMEADFYVRNLEQTDWEGGTWLRAHEPHPYFGFVATNADSIRANNYGFTESEPFPYQKKSADEYVIAVLGGSVAQSWATWIKGGGSEHFLSALKKRIPALGKRKVVLLNMSLGGFKQPQQYYVASYFLESVDLFVNLEGFNELYGYKNAPVYPVEYPVASYLFFWRGKQAIEASWKLQLMGRWNHFLMEKGARHRWLAPSALYFSLAKGVFRWTADASAEVAEKARKSAEQELSNPHRSFYTEGEKKQDPRQAAVEIWERFVRQEQQIVTAFGKRAVFFLQPNQYLLGSKPFNAWEIGHVFNKNVAEKTHEYRMLTEAVKRMRGRKLPIHDLTMIYATEKETVYADSCCHVNELGNRIMSEAIAKGIAESLR
jgi:hypothetical protein